MANICLYKIKVKGKKNNCLKFEFIMPRCDWDFQILESEGTDDDYTFSFITACKWGVDYRTQKTKGKLNPLTDEEISSIEDGDYWGTPLQEKAKLLGCEVFCNMKDIDDCYKAVYVHYSPTGRIINDECPKELHIKRGRDYDEGYVEPEKNHKLVRVKFVNGKSYEYNGDGYEVGDIVNVEGSMSNILGQIISEKMVNSNTPYCKIVKKYKNIPILDLNKVDEFWSSCNKEKKKRLNEYYKTETNLTKASFKTIVFNDWIISNMSNEISILDFKTKLENI